MWKLGQDDEAESLASCYRNSLELAEERSAESIAFPAISCGAFRYPVDQGSKVAVESVRAYLEASHGSITRVIFACPDPKTLRFFRKAVQDRADGSSVEGLV